MKEILKKDWLFAILSIVLLVLSIISVANLKYGFFTAYDESYFLLKMQEAYDMSCITGKSQWNLLAAHWFPFLDLTSVVQSRLASCVLMWLTIILSTATCCIVFDKKRFIKYFALIFLVYFTTGGVMCYNPMRVAVTNWALCSFVLFYYAKKMWTKYLWAGICGLCLGLLCFIVIPAALALLACIAILICVLYWNDKKQMGLFLLFGVSGVLLSIVYVHFVVCDIPEIVDAMLFTASYIGKSGYHYDGASFILQYGLLVRDFIFALLVMIGAYWLASKTSKKWLLTLIYTGLILIYLHYQVKPLAPTVIFYTSIVIIPCLFSDRFSLQALKLPNNWFYVFLFLFPFIAPFGTNGHIISAVGSYSLAWFIIFFNQERERPTENWNHLLFAIVVIGLIPLNNVIRNYQSRDDSHHFTRGNQYFSEIAITEKQEDYFNRVYDILEEYNYQPKQSAVLTACYDYCCLYAFDAVNAANYHQVQNFHYFPKENMIEPDFVFLCKWDSIVMAKELQEMPWGWPEEFDEYFVGSPEPDDAPWVNHLDLEQRKLYCRKSLKNYD